MNPRSTKQDTEDQKDTFKEKLGTRVFDLKKDCSEAPLGQKGARKERERAQRARALKEETLSAKYLETAFALKGFIFRDGKTPGSGICRNRSGRPRHKSCLPRRTSTSGPTSTGTSAGRRHWAAAVRWHGLQWRILDTHTFRFWSASLELVVVSRVLSQNGLSGTPPLRYSKTGRVQDTRRYAQPKEKVPPR